MQNIAKLLLGATLLGTASVASAAAEFLTVEIKARVWGVTDSGNVLGGQVTVGQVLTGSYTYDINATDQDSSPTYGFYRQPQGRVKLTAGSLVFESPELSPSNRWNHIYVEVEPSQSPGNYPGHFRVNSQDNNPLPNGASVSQMRFVFGDQNGNEIATDALPTIVPTFFDFPMQYAFVAGELNGQSYSFGMDIEYTYSAGVESELVISPGKSTFVRSQRFDVALVGPEGSEIVRARSSINGMPSPMEFPGECHLQLGAAQNRPTIFCVDAQRHFFGVEGKQLVEWELELSSGRTIGHSVEWNFLQ